MGEESGDSMSNYWKASCSSNDIHLNNNKSLQDDTRSFGVSAQNQSCSRGNEPEIYHPQAYDTSAKDAIAEITHQWNE